MIYLKPKRKPQGIRGLNNQTVKENNVEQNIKTEIAKEIKPSKIKYYNSILFTLLFVVYHKSRIM